MPKSQKFIVVSVPGSRADFEKWIATRGGVQVWITSWSNPGATPVFTPAKNGAGNKYPQPSVGATRGPVIKDIEFFRFIAENVEVDRFKVKTARGAQGLQIKLSDESSALVRNRCKNVQKKHGRPAYYEFDYTSKECFITIPIYEGEDKEEVLKGTAKCST